MSWWRRSLRSCVVIVLTVAAATAITSRLLPVDRVGVSPLLFAAVMVSAWYGGWVAAIAATVLAAVAADYFFILPVHSMSVAADARVGLTVFVVSAAMTGMLPALSGRLAARSRRAREVAEAAAAAQASQFAAIGRQLREPLEPALLTVSVLERERRLHAVVRQEMGNVRRGIEAGLGLIDALGVRSSPGRLAISDEAEAAAASDRPAAPRAGAA